MKTIFSFSGGGVKGLRSQTVATEIERILQAKTNPHARLVDYVDLFAGTSTGAIQVACMTAPLSNGRPMSAQDLLNFYFNRSAEIFSLRKPFSLVLSPKYSEKPFKRIAEEMFGEMQLSSLLASCFITAYDLAEPKEFFFTNGMSDLSNDHRVVDAVLSSCFAPTYFPPYIFEDWNGVDHAMWDGGVFMGDPSLGAYTEITKMYPGITPSEVLLVSFGTGHADVSYDYEKLAKAGAIGTIQPLLDVMLSASGRTVTYHLTHMFAGTNNFYHLNPEQGTASSEMDDASTGNLENLHRSGVEYCEANRDVLEEIIDRLIANKKNENV